MTLSPCGRCALARTAVTSPLPPLCCQCPPHATTVSLEALTLSVKSLWLLAQSLQAGREGGAVVWVVVREVWLEEVG